MDKATINKLRKLELQSKLKVGAFVKNVWGATMQRVEYYEVASIEDKGKRIGLRRAVITGDPSPNCTMSTVELIGSNPSNPIVAYATTRMGYLIKEGSSLRDYWSTFEFVQIGDKTDTWSD